MLIHLLNSGTGKNPAVGRAPSHAEDKQKDKKEAPSSPRSGKSPPKSMHGPQNTSRTGIIFSTGTYLHRARTLLLCRGEKGNKTQAQAIYGPHVSGESPGQEQPEGVGQVCVARGVARHHRDRFARQVGSSAGSKGGQREARERACTFTRRALIGTG